MESQWMSICTRAAKQLQVIANASAVRKRSMSAYEREIHELEELKHALPDGSNISSLEELKKSCDIVQVNNIDMQEFSECMTCLLIIVSAVSRG